MTAITYKMGAIQKPSFSLVQNLNLSCISGYKQMCTIRRNPKISLNPCNDDDDDTLATLISTLLKLAVT